MLLWSGARCCTRTKAIPGSASTGMPEKKASNAASPPADAPMPTIGNPGASGADGGSTAVVGLGAAFGSFALRLVVAMMAFLPLPLLQIVQGTYRSSPCPVSCHLLDFDHTAICGWQG